MAEVREGARGGPGTEPDPAVAAAFARGEADALARVYDQFSRAVWVVAMSVLRDRQLAEDATQETFVRAWKAAASFDPRRPLAPWLLTVARRTALDVYRREARPTLGGHEAEQDRPTAPPGFERAWEAWEIRLALDALPEEERVVVRMAHFDGMTHREISERLGVPVGTVKSRSYRAHRRLAELLAHLLPESPAGGARPDEAVT